MEDGVRLTVADSLFAKLGNYTLDPAAYLRDNQSFSMSEK